MHIIEFQAENIKRLKAVTIRPDGPVVLLTGANMQGKSSVLDAIFMAFGGSKAIPSHPVREGEEKAFVRLDLGEIIVTRRFTADGTTSLTVEAQSGAKFPSPQKMLDDLVGSLSFDPLEFSRMQAKQQLETLRGMVPLDEDIDALDFQAGVLYGERATANKEVRRLEAAIGAVIVADGTPDEAVDIMELVGQLTDAGNKNAALAKELSRRENVQANAGRIMREGEAFRQQAAKLLEQAAAKDIEADGMLSDLSLEPALEPPVDTAALQEQVNGARGLNARVQEKQRRAKLQSELKTAQVQSDELTARRDTLLARRHKALATATMPVEGLSFGEGEVLYNGLPFAQASGAQQLTVSIAIAMAANPKLRVLRIKDGSLLDENSLGLVQLQADMQGYQIWIEKVDTTGKLGIVIEDGEVKQ